MNEILAYVVNSGVWSAVGFAVGFSVARLRKEVRDLDAKVDRIDQEHRTD